MKKIILVTTLIISTLATTAQVKYWVFFTDKQVTASMLEHPENILSERSIARRQTQYIAINESDFPVSKNYIKQLQKQGVMVLRTSKWLNAASVFATVQQIEELKKLPFVSSVKPVMTLERQAESMVEIRTTLTSYSYGNSWNQVSMLGGNVLHDAGSRGQGMLIAVLDGGFSGADTVPAFDSLYAQNGILLTKDYVDGDTNVFHRGSHGTSVLSVMAANLDGQLIGTAPQAQYILLQSENQINETTIEEDNWVAAAEFADSVGAQIITSSLGYTTFDGGIGDYTYNDLDGRTATTSIAALMAARKGILVINSAGNEGGSSWRYIITPADADSILAIGGVDEFGQRVGFSSIGPTADNRIKPDICAKAQGVVVANSFGTLSAANGTSFSAPLIAGLSACLWQRHPSATNFQVRTAIMESASQFLMPDTLMGYGIPNFVLADYYLSVIGNEEFTQPGSEVMLYPNPFDEKLTLHITFENLPPSADIQVYSINGALLSEIDIPVTGATTELQQFQNLPAGNYIFKVNLDGKVYTFKMLR